MINKIKKRSKSVIKSEKGEFSYVFASVLIVVMFMIASFVWTYTEVLTTIRESKNSAVVSLRYVQSYEGMQAAMTGRGGRRTRYTDKVLTDTQAYDEFMFAYTKNSGGLEEISGNMLYSMNENGTENYHISAPTLEASVSDNRTVVTYSTTYTLSIPLRFMGETVTYLQIPMKEELSCNINSIANT